MTVEIVERGPCLGETRIGRDKLIATYREKLAEAHSKHPDVYAWPLSELEAVMGRMVIAIDRLSFNKDSHAWRNTCEALRIKHTYRDIETYLAS